LSGIKLQLQKPKEALKLIQDSVDNDPNIAEGWLRLATIYYSLGDLKTAKSTIETAQARGLQFDEKGQTAINFIMSATNVKK
jgi:predicted Zn-dependent protease